MNAILKYSSMVKFSHTLFALPFACIGFVMAFKLGINDWSWVKLLLMLLCMVTARNAAMAFNRLVDRKYDALNPRTKEREIPANKIKPVNAILFVIINVVLFVVSTYFINKLCFYLSPIALFVVLGYSYTKRITYLCHFVLGIGLSLAPIGAFLVLHGAFHIVPILLSITVLFWVSGFDIIYALQDIDFDKKNELYSVPARFGFEKSVFIVRFIHLLSIVPLLVIGVMYISSIFYWIGVVVFISLLLLQHFLVYKYKLEKVNLAFFTANGIASLLFALFSILSMLI